MKATPATPGETTSATSSQSPTAPATGDQRCHSDQLAVSMSSVEGAAGSLYFHVRLRNTGDTACTMGGYGGLSFVDADGNQIGAAAVRDDTGGPAKAITLQPGASAASRVQQAQADNYSTAKCRPKQAASLKVYPPNDTGALTVAYSAKACANKATRLLQVRPYRPARAS